MRIAGLLVRTPVTTTAGGSPVQFSDGEILRRVGRELRPHALPIAVLVALDLLIAPLLLVTPLPLKIAVDSALQHRPLPGPLAALPVQGLFEVLLLAAALQVLVVVAVQLRELAAYVLVTQVGEQITLAFRARMFWHVQRLSLSFHDSRGTADTLYRIEYDAPSIQYLTIYGALPLLASVLSLVAMVYVTARLSWQLAAVALSITPILYVLADRYRRAMREQYTSLKSIESGALGVVQEVLAAVRVVKAFGREDTEQQRFVTQSARGVRAKVRAAFADGSFGLLVNVTIAIGTALALFFGVRSVSSGALTLGELLLILGYLTQMYEPLASISKQATGLQSSMASAHRAFETLETAPEVQEKPNALRIDRARGEIELEAVSFWYDPRHPILANVSFNIAQGTRLGLVGRTGAGKTTLISLLTRFYDPRRGRILLDGVDMRDYRIADLRSQFGIVLQEPVLFSTTIRENIAYGRPDASEEEITAAADAAGAHDFIRSLPDGYDAVVGERGMTLSGGERQRISLARAFLKDAPILILDEPTSSVDVQTEAAIMAAMERLMDGRTTIMIAHRLSTLDTCDEVIELRQGRVADALSRHLPEV